METAALPDSQSPANPAPAAAEPVGLLALLREEYRVNGPLLRPGFQTMALYRIAVWSRQLHPVLGWPVRLLCRIGNVWCRNVYGIELHPTAKIGRRLRIPHQGGIVIHYAATLGDDCLIEHNATIGGTNRGSESDAPTLGNNVAVAVGAAVLGKIRVGDGARIGPNCVVMMNVPPGAIVCVPPPRLIMPPKPRNSHEH